MQLSHDAEHSSQNDGIEFYLSEVSEHRDFPGRWGFEIFTNEWLSLGHFTFPSESDANKAANEFVWLMGKFCPISLVSEALRLDGTIKSDEKTCGAEISLGSIGPVQSSADQVEDDACV